MCNRKSQTKTVEYLADYYSASYNKVLEEVYSQQFHENAFDCKQSPIVTADKPNELQMFHWGLVPSWASEGEAMTIKTRTVNCRSEEMYDKRSFKDIANGGQRCLIPCSGFFEHKHINNGKLKIPYFIGLKDQDLFSLAGLFSLWQNKTTDQYYYSYTVLTTVANPFMEEIHNSGKRMPVIIPRDFERDWLNPNLTKEDVLAMCAPLDDSKMQAHTVSKLLTKKGVDNNVAEVLIAHDYLQEIAKAESKSSDTNSQTSLLF
jgi:putative SOS response-associated peptidase YedK